MKLFLQFFLVEFFGLDISPSFSRHVTQRQSFQLFEVGKLFLSTKQSNTKQANQSFAAFQPRRQEVDDVIRVQSGKLHLFKLIVEKYS